MGRYLRFNDYILNESKAYDNITNKLVSAYPNLFAIHSNSTRIKNTNNISAEEFEQKIQEILNIKNSKIINPPMSGSSKFKAVKFKYQGSQFMLVLAGGAVASKGHGFEYDLEADLKTLAEHKVYDKELYVYDSIIKDIIKEFNITEKSDIQVIAEGGKNKKRPVLINADGSMIVGDGTLDIGHIVTDITLVVDGDSKFFSLKLGPTSQFANTGIATLFPKSEVNTGKISNKLGIKLLDFFGLDNSTFCDVYNSYGKKNFKKQHATKSVDKRKVEKFLKSAIGYGYYMIHTNDTADKYKFYKVDKAYMNKASKLGGNVKILYGGTRGKAKNTEVKFETPIFSMTVDFRDRLKGIEPTVMGTKYTYLNFKGKSVE